MKGLSPEEQMEAALSKGLSQDRSDINSKPVYRKLDEKSSEPRYEAMWNFWKAYKKEMEKKNPGIYIDLDDITTAKHVAKAVGLATQNGRDGWQESGREGYYIYGGSPYPVMLYILAQGAAKSR
ncbi:hypothetical protein G7Y89_g9283 [Cudoniella acicularis]|uniref:Uncharacterized protein n=1 Tax=Cudoniella acicularis TaxID=354080 RepID=A0A8H4RHL3_9HELO|nr:hypothetical protein G7Y89_g9283 [Cudoniella acicularis]